MIVLVGFMGAGKTTVGQLLAGKLGLPFADTDLVIERRTRRSVREIFASDGESAFRDLESRVTAEVLAGADAVVALGGGAVEHPATQRALRSHHVVYLKVGYTEAMVRVGGDEGRPVLRSPDLAAIYERRLPAYEAVASQVLDVAGCSPEELCGQVLARLAGVA